MIDHENLEEFRDPQIYDLQDEGYDDDWPLTEQWAFQQEVARLDLGRMYRKKVEDNLGIT